MGLIRHQYDKRLNVKYFGAVGDGQTDDTQAFKDAIAAALSPLGGNHIFVPHGRFAVAPVIAGAAILLTQKKGLTIEGVNKYTSVMTFTEDNPQSCIFGFVDCDDIEIRNLGFDGRVTTATRVPWNRAIDARGVINLDLDHIRTIYTGNSALRVATKGLGGSDAIPHGTRPAEKIILANSRIEHAYGSGGILTKSAGANKVTIIDNFFDEIGIQAISLESEDALNWPDTVFHGEHIVTGNHISNTDAEGYGASTVGYGIAIQELVGKQIISDNQFNNIGGLSAIDLSTSSTQSDTELYNIVIEGNYIDTVNQGSRTCGINLRSGDAGISNVSIRDNDIYNARYGVQFYPQTQTTTEGVIKDIKISDNRINADNIGIWYNDTDGNVAAKKPVEDIQIVGNKIYGRQLCVQLLVDGLQCSGNRLRRLQGTTGWTHSIGIRAGSSNLEIYGNDMPDMVAEGSTVPPVRLNGEFSPWHLGEYYLWVDTAGRLRIGPISQKPDITNRDSIGTIVGGQI